MELATERPAPERPGLETDVCIVGAGPAGAMLGLLCARAGRLSGGRAERERRRSEVRARTLRGQRMLAFA